MQAIIKLIPLLALVGCTSKPIVENQLADVVSGTIGTSSTPELVLAWGTEHQEWTDFLLAKIAEYDDMLSVVPEDYADLCPAYRELSKKQRAEVLAHTMSIMAKYESNWSPSATYKESFADKHGKPVISSGLMQISIESANAYGCGFKSQQELFNPKDNLGCSVKIIRRWIIRDKRFGGKVSGKWKGIARYWSVARSYSNSNKKIRSYVSGLPVCR